MAFVPTPWFNLQADEAVRTGKKSLAFGHLKREREGEKKRTQDVRRNISTDEWTPLGEEQRIES